MIKEYYDWLTYNPAKNDIKQLSHYIYSHLCKYRPLKGLLKSVNIKAGRKLKLR